MVRRKTISSVTAKAEGHIIKKEVKEEKNKKEKVGD
jgi:hypothetical protein